VKHLSGPPPYDRLQTITTNITLGWISLPWTITLAYYKKIVNYICKKFYNIGPWPT